jgi:hypothetical protein
MTIEIKPSQPDEKNNQNKNTPPKPQPPKATTRDTVAYVILVVGLVLLLFQASLGGLIVGLIAGLFFSDELIRAYNYIAQAVKTQGNARTIIGAGLLLGLFISAPAIFIGALIAAGISQVVNLDMFKK